MAQSEISRLLSEGVAAAKASYEKSGSAQSRADQRDLARQRLLQVVESDETIPEAWLWLSTVVDNPDEQVVCLRNVLELDPNNTHAKKRLARLEQAGAATESRAGSLSGQANPHTHCPFCKKPFSGSEPVCSYCRSPLVMDCPNCGTLMDVEYSACAKCNYPLPDHRLGSVFFTLLAEEYRSRHRLSRALEALRVAERLNPDQPDLYRQMGEVLTELSEPLAAIPVLEKAIEKEPEQIGPYLALGKVLQQEGKWEDAERVYRAAMRTAPESSETYFALGSLLLQYDKPDEARKQLQYAVKIDPHHGLAWLRLGQLYERQGQDSAAIKAFRQARSQLDEDSLDNHLAVERLLILDPQLPDRVARSWSALLRQLSAPLLLGVLAVGIGTVVIRSGQFHWTAILSLLMSWLGAFLWVSAHTLPKNPLICAITGSPDGLSKMENLPVLAGVGGLLWLIAIVLALIPL